MPKGNRSKELRAIGLTLGTLTAGCFVIGGAFWLGQYQADYLHRQEEGRAARQEAPDTKCYTVFGTTLLCVGGENDASAEAERSEQDLQAQQNMAEWAKWVTGFTAAQLGVGLLGTILLVRTIRETRKGNKINRQLGQAQVRAYVSWGGAKTGASFDADGKPIAFRAVASVQNTGQSPALLRALYVDLKVVFPSETPIVTFDLAKAATDVEIGAGRPFNFLDQSVSIEDAMLVMTGQRRLYLMGWCSYRDVFWRPATEDHVTRFCFEVTFGVQPDMLTREIITDANRHIAGFTSVVNYQIGPKQR